MKEEIMKIRTFYFYFHPDTKKALTPSVPYSQLEQEKLKIKTNGFEPKMAEFTYDFSNARIISMLPENAVPLETKYKTAEHLQEEQDPEVKEKKVTTFTIREPIWKEPRSVALNHKEILGSNTDVICVKIIYRMRKKNDELLYPDPFFIDREKALKYPVQKVSGGTYVTIIPIRDFRDRA